METGDQTEMGGSRAREICAGAVSRCTLHPSYSSIVTPLSLPFFFFLFFKRKTLCQLVCQTLPQSPSSNMLFFNLCNPLLLFISSVFLSSSPVSPPHEPTSSFSFFFFKKLLLYINNNAGLYLKSCYQLTSLINTNYDTPDCH